MLGLLRRRGLLVDDDADYDPDSSCVDDPVLASCYAHALRVPQQRLSMATPRPGSKPVSKSRRCAKFGGFDLHAAVTVSPDDRYALERLCRYLCRPALSHERLELLDDAHVGLELKTPFSDGTSHLALSFDELLQRLCALVPRPGTHRVHYHGILAPAARHRSKVVPEPDVPELTESDDTALLGFDDDSPLKKRSKTVRKLLWAELLQRVASCPPPAQPENRPIPVLSEPEARPTRALGERWMISEHAPLLSLCVDMLLNTMAAVSLTAPSMASKICAPYLA